MHINSKNILKLIIILVLIVIYKNVKSQSGTEVILQAYNWESCQNGWWTTLNSKVSDISLSGIDVVWLPPASKSADCQGFRPTEYYNINNSYGSQAQLQTLISSFHSKNIKVLADIVVNHREGSGSCQAFYNPDWGNWSICNNDAECPGSGAADTGEGFSAGRDLDHTNTGVQDGIKWMLKGILKDQIGFDGWRYDYSKGYSGQYVGIYNQASSPFMSVGEYWKPMNYNVFNLLYDQNSHRQEIQSWITATNNTSCAFDFTTKGMLQEAVQYSRFSYLKDTEGKPTGLIGINPSKAVTFIDNHDTGGSQNHWPFHGDTKDQALKELRVTMGYAYILTHPGIPCIFWDHLYSWGTATVIKGLIEIRRKNGINSSSTLTIEKAVDNDCYAAVITGTKGKIAVKIGPGSWSPSGNWISVTKGTNYEVWEYNPNVNIPGLNISPTGGTYIGGTTVTLTANGTNPPFSIYYTTDGSTPTTSSTKVTSGSKINIINNTILKAFVVDAVNTPSAIITNTYITKESGFRVYFKKPITWTEAHIHAWGPAPDYTSLTGSWPGPVMTDAGNGWYSYYFPSSPIVNLIFNNGMSGTDEIKTKDITDISSEIWYDFDKGIVTGVPDIQLNENDLEVYPNPVTDILNVRSEKDFTSLSIHNLLGEKIRLIENISTSQLNIDVGDLAPGFYYISFSIKRGDESIRKFVKR